MGDVIKCKFCNSSQIYYRCRTNFYHCVKCGKDFEKKEGDDKQ